jgi:hypothetical protein
MLIAHLCKNRATLDYTADGVSYATVECLTPLSRVWNRAGNQAAAVVQLLDPSTLPVSTRLGVFGVSLIRDLLKEKAAESLSEACSRPRGEYLALNSASGFPAPAGMVQKQYDKSNSSGNFCLLDPMGCSS